MPGSSKFPYLLKPLRVGDLELRNRVVLAPLTRGRAGASRDPNALMAEYYRQRASGGLLISEAVGISEEGYGWNGAPGIYTEEQSKKWRQVTEAVHKEGGLIFLQLWHMGRASHSSFSIGAKYPGTVSASAIAAQGTVYTASGEKQPYEVPRALETDEIARVGEDYRRAARLAMEGGFDGVELHGANGYLIDQFLQSCSNKRDDKYGGSKENRYRFLEEILNAVKREVPSNRIGVRLSPNGIFGSMGSEDNDVMFPYVAERLSEHNLGYLHVMDGLGFGFHRKCKAVTLHEMKARFGGLVIGNVGFEPETAEGAIRTGAVDAVAFGRRYISNPDLVERIQNGHPLEDAPGMEFWYFGGEQGYTTYKSFAEKTKADSS